MTPYETLGVASTATEAEIKSAFRRLAKTAHPDMHGGDRAVFERLNAAYALLMDRERRAHYDATGEIVEDAPDNGHAPVLSCLSQAFNAAVDQSLKQGREPHRSDLIAMMRAQLQAGMAARAKECAEAKRGRPKWEALRDRFTVADGKENIMAGIVAARIADMDRMGQQYEQADKVARAALEVLDDHHFSFEAIQTVQIRPSQTAGLGGLYNLFNNRATS